MGKEHVSSILVDICKRTVIVLGNEGAGVHNKIKEAFNKTVTIPHCELVESLNVACAAVPILLERQRAAFSKNSEDKSD